MVKYQKFNIYNLKINLENKTLKNHQIAYFLIKISNFNLWIRIYFIFNIVKKFSSIFWFSYKKD